MSASNGSDVAFSAKDITDARKRRDREFETHDFSLGPSRFEWPDGTVEYRDKNYLLHNEEGPALTLPNGSWCWLTHGLPDL